MGRWASQRPRPWGFEHCSIIGSVRQAFGLSLTSRLETGRSHRNPSIVCHLPPYDVPGAEGGGAPPRHAAPRQAAHRVPPDVPRWGDAETGGTLPDQLTSFWAYFARFAQFFDMFLMLLGTVPEDKC